MHRILFLLSVLLFSNMNIAYAQKGDRLDADVPYTMTIAEAMVVQNTLYELNYDVGKIDGVVGSVTSESLARWQKNTSRESTGIITESQFKILSAMKLSPGVWAAVGSSTDGEYAAVWNHSSRASAETAAMSDCRGKSTSPDKCITLTAVTRNPESQDWIAAVHCKRLNGTGTFFETSLALRKTRQDAVDAAYIGAVSDGQVARNDCSLRVVIETRGRHV